MGKRSIFAALISGAMILSATLAPTLASAETLTDALISAYRNSNLLDQNQAVLRAADEDVAIAVSSLLPVVSYTAQSAYAHSEQASIFSSSLLYIESWQTQVTLSASMMLYDWGRGKLGIEIARQNVLATREALRVVEQSVLLDAVTAYVDLRLQASIVALRESNMRLITQQLRAARDRFEVGEVTRTDVALAEASLAGAKAGLAAAQGAYSLSRERFNATIGHYPGQLATLPRAPSIPKSVDAARGVALKNHPNLAQIKHQVTVADLQVDLAKAAMKPMLTTRADLSERVAPNAQGAGSQTLGVTLSQTIYAGGQLSALYRRALAGQDSARAGLHQTAVVVTENVGRAWANLAVAAASIEAGDQQIRASQAAYDGVKEEADLGSRTTLDVLNAEQTLLDARASRLQAEANLYVGQYTLLSAMGLLTVDHLNLGIPSFDPEVYYNAVKNAPATSAQGAKLDRILKSLGN